MMDKNKLSTQENKIKRRAIIVASIMALFIMTLFGRLYYLQTVKAEWLYEQAENVWSKNSIIQAERGMILDRDGEKLAYNSKAYTLIAYPHKIEDTLYVARKLSEKINMSEKRINELINQNVYQVELGPGGRKISEGLLEEILALELKGIAYKEDTIRAYPNNSLASHVIGFINAAEEGVIGIELQYDDILKGQDGKISYISDNKKRNIFAENNNYLPKIDGKNIVLTLESRIQYYVEKHMEEAIEKYKAKNMTIIVANPNNGEILALANTPNFNLNSIKEDDIDNIYKNFALEQFEPGSTFKVNVLAIALEEKKAKLSDTVLDEGVIKIPGGSIKNSTGKGEGEITFQKALQVSSNVAFTDLALNRIGDQLLFENLSEYGFGARTGIELPFEMTGDILVNRKRYPFEVATASFGQGVAVTPIQQIQAISAIANGGYLIKPSIIKDIIDKDSIIEYNFNVNKETLPKEENRIMSKYTAEQMAKAMEETVKDGSAYRASIEGIRVAGKTGTSEKIDETGNYSKDKFIVSFIGFAPVEKPEVIVYIALDEPVHNDVYGGTIAAPIFSDLTSDIINYLNVKNQSVNRIKKDEETVVVENYLGKYVSESILIAENNGVNVKFIGDSNMVIQQNIKAGTPVKKNTNLILITGDGLSNYQDNEEIISAMIGYSKNYIIRFLSFVDIEYEIQGNGYLVDYEFFENEDSDRVILFFSSLDDDIIVEDISSEEE